MVFIYTVTIIIINKIITNSMVCPNNSVFLPFPPAFTIIHHPGVWLAVALWQRVQLFFLLVRLQACWTTALSSSHMAITHHETLSIGVCFVSAHSQLRHEIIKSEWGEHPIRSRGPLQYLSYWGKRTWILHKYANNVSNQHSKTLPWLWINPWTLRLWGDSANHLATTVSF